MSFQAKSHLTMLIVLAAVYGAYFFVVLRWAAVTPVDDIIWQPLMLATVIPVAALAAVGHIVIAVISPTDAGAYDERDRLIDLRGESLGGLLLGIGVFAALALTMFEADTFWIAQVLVGALVVSEVVAAVTKLALYRRGV